MNKQITVETVIDSDLETVWKCWTDPQDIKNWNHASDDWYCPEAENDLRVGGSFSSTMSSRDDSISFEFKGVYTKVEMGEEIAYEMEDGRKVSVIFSENVDGVTVVETFDPENENSEEMQREGWQAILDNFKKYVESKK